MNLKKMGVGFTAIAALLSLQPSHGIAAVKAEVIHWWTSGGEAAAVKKFAEAFRATGGVWIDTAIAGGEQSRSVTINRMVGGNPPTAAQFNTSKQFVDLVEQNLLTSLDDVAKKDNWDKLLPDAVLNVIKVNGHFYAAPVNIHMPTWIWYSKAAFKKAGIAKEPASFDELFGALDQLRKSGIVPLAHGGQPWQENLVFAAVLANVGGRDLYLRILRDRDQKAIVSDEFKKVLLTYKRLQGYVDPGSPGRNWNDATAMLISGKAGVQIIGDWAKGEFTLANQQPGRDYGCIPGFGPNAPYIIQGDVFVFPKTANKEVAAAQKILATAITAPAVQVDFSLSKGSIPIRPDVDATKLDQCAQMGLEILKGKTRLVGNGEMYMSPDQNGALSDILTSYWNKNIPVEKVQRDIAAAIKN
jgi:glucose/mannose transport system substrate-binding protein